MNADEFVLYLLITHCKKNKLNKLKMEMKWNENPPLEKLTQTLADL